MFAFKVDIEAIIDIKLLDARIKEIRSDSGLRQQLGAERERVKQLEAKIAKLQVSGSTASKQEVRDVINGLSAIDWFNKGRGQGYDITINCCSKAIELDPQFAEAYDWRGLMYYKLGNYDAAIRDYNKVIELGPQLEHRDEIKWAVIEWIPLADAYYFRGCSYFELGNYDAAIRDMNKVKELDPQFAEAYSTAGMAYYRLGNKKAAADGYNSYLRITGNKHGKAEEIRQMIKDLGYTPEY
jgi:tetratricopeptide (TPR) repeat protein